MKIYNKILIRLYGQFCGFKVVGDKSDQKM